MGNEALHPQANMDSFLATASPTRSRRALPALMDLALGYITILVRWGGNQFDFRQACCDKRLAFPLLDDHVADCDRLFSRDGPNSMAS